MTDFPDQEHDQWNQADSPSPPSDGKGGGLAIASLVLGIVGMLGWCIPLCGFPINLVGLILGIMGLKSPNRTLAIVGVVLCSIGLLLSVINGIAGAIMAINGTHPFVQP